LTGPPSLSDKIQQTVDVCTQALGPIASLTPAPEKAFALLQLWNMTPESQAEIRALKSSATVAKPGDFERAILLSAAIRALERMPLAQVTGEVNTLLCDEFSFIADPAPRRIADFSFDSPRFLEMAKIVTFRRFPAGILHWEIAGIPRSLLWRIHGERWKFWASVLGGCRGFRPVWEVHLDAKSTPVLIEPEWNLACYRVAESMRLNPQVRAFMSWSWIYCPEIAKVTPHLAWLRRYFETRGAVLADTGPAGPETGFLHGSEKRRKMYREGRLNPCQICVIWSRRAILAWADRERANMDRIASQPRSSAC